jgi:ubiquinone/menaquinone biosynthesis C-methylase UbiE
MRFIQFARASVRRSGPSSGGFLLAVAALAAVAVPVVAQPWNRDFGEDMKRLVPALELRAGQTVADIGAGGGELSVALAKAVGPDGAVYATEIDRSRMDRIRRRAADAGLANVTVVEAHATRTNLPDGCCDAIVIRNVYHHFDDPEAMNRSLLATLKPGGRLAIIDFSPGRGAPTASSPARRDADSSHGVDLDAVVRELTAAGFERVAVERADDRSYLAVFQRPS